MFVEANAKKTGMTLIILLLLGIFSSMTFLPANVSAKTLYVGGGGPGNYTTIQGAIDDANRGDTIYVYSGTYYEHVGVNKPLTLSGDNRDTTIVDGGGIGTVVRVSTDWVNITGFTLTNSGQEFTDAGIELIASHDCHIAQVNVSNNREGILIQFSSNITVENSTFLSNSGNGILLRYTKDSNLIHNTMIGSGMYIVGNLLEHWNTHTIDLFNTVNGKPVHYWKDLSGGVVPPGAGQVILANCTNVVIENQTVNDGSLGIELGFSSNNLVNRNTASRNSYDGILLFYSNNNTVSDNTGSSNKGHGIHFILSSNNTLVDNDAILNGGDGISLTYSNDNAIASNNVSLSYYVGLRLDSSDGNRVYHNIFMNNSFQAWDNTGTNQWDDGYPSGGNYWSDYAGMDEFSGPNQNQPGNDGIGDTPYVIGIGIEDEYPLMSPTSMIHPQPPRMLRASLSGGGLENITLVWALSPDDGSGLESVVRYEIYRNTAYDAKGFGYGLIASLPNGTTVFVDNDSGEGDPNYYFYQVCAVDANDNTICTYNQAGKFTYPLTSGPNLVSIPLIQYHESIETVLQTVSYDRAWLYDSLSQEWKWFTKYKSYRRGLWNINHTMGLWVNVTDVCSLTVAGVVPTQTAIQLFEGWNLVSFPSFNMSYSVADLKIETGAKRVEGLETMPPFPPSRLRVLRDADVLRTGEAYWIEVDWDTVWAVGVS